MAGINFSSTLFSRPAIPVQFDMSAQILGGGSPLLPMEFLPPLLPGAALPGAGAPAPAPAKDKGKKGDKKAPAPSSLNPAMAALGWELDKNGMLKLSEKGKKDYVNGIVGDYLSGAQQLGSSFAAFLGAPF